MIWDHGIFEVRKQPKHLLLRDAQSNPDRGVIAQLYAPAIYDLTMYPGEELMFRGFELVEGSERKAMVCQEWAVVFGGEAPSGITLRKYR